MRGIQPPCSLTNSWTSQTDAAAFVRAAAGVLDPVEALEQSRKLFGGDARAVSRTFKLDRVLAP